MRRHFDTAISTLGPSHRALGLHCLKLSAGVCLSYDDGFRKKDNRVIPDLHVEAPSDFFDELNIEKVAKVDLNKFQKGIPEGGKCRRISERYNLQLTALIVSSSRTFRTTTVNASNAGVLLAETLPQDLIGKEFELLLIDDKSDGTDKYLRFKATAVGGKITPRLQFLASSPETKYLLSKMLEDLTVLVA